MDRFAHPSLRQWVMLGYIALSLLAVRLLWPFLTPLALALLLTYIMIPVVDRVESTTLWSRTASAAFVYLLLLIAIILVPVLVSPVIVAQVQSFTPTVERGAEQLGSLIANLGTTTIMGQTIDLYDLYLQFSSSLVSVGTNVASTSVNVVFGFATTFFATVLWLLFMLVISFYIVRDSPNISRYLWGLVPRDLRPDVYYLTRRIDRTWHAFLRGQLFLSTVIFVVTTLALLILGVPQPLLLGFMAGVLNLMPNLGPILSSIPAIGVALIQGSTHFDISPVLFALIVAGTYTLIQQLEGNFLVPRIIGGSVNLHPAVVILGTIIGLSTVGILGIFLAAPTLASLRVISGYTYHKLLDPSFQPDVVLPDAIAAIPDPRERPVPPLPPPVNGHSGPTLREWLKHNFSPPSKESKDG